MANRKSKKNNSNNNSGNIWKKRYLQALAIVSGFVPDSSMNVSALSSIVSVSRAKMGSEHSLPDQLTEIVQFVMNGLGSDPNEIQRALAETIPAKDIATVEGVSVESVQENRQQVREARKTTGVFSAETRAARQDLRQDRRATRRERRKGGTTGAAAVAGFLGGLLK
jgi:hypothetical protein